MVDEAAIGRRFALLSPHLDVGARGLLAAAESAVLGRGGISQVARATGVSRGAIRAAMKEINRPGMRRPGKGEAGTGRIRRKGGGRKKVLVKDGALLPDLERLIDPVSDPDHDPPLRWTRKSVRTLARELQKMGHRISHTVVAKLLVELDYRLQTGNQAPPGRASPDRNAQFEFVNRCVRQFRAQGQPAIFVEAKRWAGNFENRGAGQGLPAVRRRGGADPNGSDAQASGLRYDLPYSDPEAAAFAVESIRRWWRTTGRGTYPAARRLLLATAAGRGSTALLRLWKSRLREFAEEAQLAILVCYFPPGTAKWNGIDQRLGCFFSQDQGDARTVNCSVIVSLIPASSGPAGSSSSGPTQVAEIAIPGDQLPGEWNYTITGRPESI